MSRYWRASERDIVVQIALAAGAGGCRLARALRRAGPGEIVPAARAEVVASASAARAVEHGQHRIEALQHNFGGIFLDAVLVGVFAGLQRSLEIDLRALLQILLDDLAQPFIEDHHAMPFGLFP